MSATAYGSPAYGLGAYGGRDSVYTPFGASVVVFDSSGAQKGVYQSGAGLFLGCEFKLDEAGCNSFSLHFAGYVSIARGDWVTIYVFDAEDPFFTGVVRVVPIQGSTSRQYDYSGYGMNDYLVRLSTGNVTYTGDTVTEIIEDLLDSVMVPNGKIKKNLLKLATPATVVTEIEFKFVSLMDALEELQKLANADGSDYLFGVDAQRDFFFRPREQAVKATLIVGAHGRYGITDYEPQDSGEPKTLLHVLKDDGTYYADFATADGTLDVFEKKVTAPKIDDADLDNWALGELWKLERYERKAQVDWQVWPQQPLLLTADGQLRVVCNRPPTGALTPALWGAGLWGVGLWGGQQYNGFSLDDTLDVVSVAYTINDREAMRRIELGTAEVDLTTEMIEINKDLAALRVSSGR